MGRKKNDGKGRLGGRTAGTPNKVTSSVKEWITKIIDGNRSQFEADLKVLEPGERVRVISGLLQYVTPKIQSASPEEMLEAEYKRFEQLLDECPNEVVDALVKKMEELRDAKER